MNMKKRLEQYSINDHKISHEDIDPDVYKISESLISNGYQAYLVGGCIRDILLGRKPKDFDIATDANPSEICKIFSHAKIIGRRFKIVHVYISEKKYFEVTTFRSDIKNKSSQKKFQKTHGMIRRDNFFGSISQDAFRRDFTVNSLYLDLDSKILHDYVNGFEDIKAKKLKLRFIRSSSASLPPAIFEQLNDIFQTPVIEAYGMTEATHQMASNPLPPAIQKPGLVGMPAGPEICIMNDKNEKLSQDEIGEICIKGDNVTNGYENNPEANKQSFVNDWFRTGDEGFFDEDGYLKISGRLKEIINKGGEKISPLEVDNILMDFPPIDQALCFGYEDKMLGEDIAVAIKLKENKSCTEDDIKSYANEKLAKFKIPKKIFIVEDIPKGATGKLQRIGLAKKFGLE